MGEQVELWSVVNEASSTTSAAGTPGNTSAQVPQVPYDPRAVLMLPQHMV